MLLSLILYSSVNSCKCSPDGTIMDWSSAFADGGSLSDSPMFFLLPETMLVSLPNIEIFRLTLALFPDDNDFFEAMLYPDFGEGDSFKSIDSCLRSGSVAITIL